ncbi:MAG: cytochrome d ubiquinol oxidase subunit II, partial [Dongiaceae bacterium]
MEYWLPQIFAGLMGLEILIYVVLDGFDLGIGILMARTDVGERDRMIASIGPFWDANETWLVLGIGLLLVAFPAAHGIILGALYLPTALLLAGLILRGVAFDFRAKARDSHKRAWDHAFFVGSLLAALAQGYMLGLYILGFQAGWASHLFALLTAAMLAGGYAFIGACWLILKTEDDLQRRAIIWARWASWLTGAGIVVVSLATPLVSPRIFDKWFVLPDLLLLAPVPVVTAALFLWVEVLLRRLPLPGDRQAWQPFVCSVAIFALCFVGLSYSFYPFVVPDRLTIWQAASAPESLLFMLVGVAIVLPLIIGYTIFSYIVFRGKARDLSYY